MSCVSAVSPVDYLTMDQVDRVVSVLDDMNATDAHDVVTMIARTGLRGMELCRDLHWDNVWCSETGTARIDFRNKKSGTARVIPLSNLVADILWARRGNPGGPFISARPRAKLEAIAREFKAACVKAGVPKVTIHSLRRTFATTLIIGGASPVVVAAIGGWKLPTLLPLLHHTLTSSVMTQYHAAMNTTEQM